MDLIYQNKITQNQSQFIEKLETICGWLGINPNWLMYVMYFESGLNPNAVNPNGGATGLIQFMPATAAGLGTSTAELRQMTNVEQLDYVYKYLKPYAGKINNLVDLYLCVFFPVALNKGPEYIFETATLSRSKIAASNPVFDLNKDGMITRAEVEVKILSGVPPEYEAIMKGENETNLLTRMKITGKEITIVIAVMTIIIAVIQIWKELNKK